MQCNAMQCTFSGNKRPIRFVTLSIKVSEVIPTRVFFVMVKGSFVMVKGSFVMVKGSSVVTKTLAAVSTFAFTLGIKQVIDCNFHIVCLKAIPTKQE